MLKEKLVMHSVIKRIQFISNAETVMCTKDLVLIHLLHPDVTEVLIYHLVLIHLQSFNLLQQRDANFIRKQNQCNK